MLVVDKTQFDYFVNLLPELRPGEVYFVSLSARNKYLTPEERVYYALGRTEMYARTVVKSKADFPLAMEKLAAADSYRTTKNGMRVPAHCRVVYVNINPSDMVGAYNVFTQEMNAVRADVMKAALNGNEPNLDAFVNMERRLLNAVQKTPGNKFYLDVDVDSKQPEVVQVLMDGLNEYCVEYHVVETHGGYHVLVNREGLNKSGYKLYQHVKSLDGLVQGEVVFNSNAMVPVPGTMQAGHLVRLLT